MSEECYLLVKRGLYYAPDRQGYTGVKARAGRYREVEALGLDGVTAIHENEAPDFSPACWESTKISVLNDRITALEAENERLREALAEAAKDIAWCAEGLTSPWAEHALKAEAKARAALTGDEQ